MSQVLSGLGAIAAVALVWLFRCVVVIVIPGIIAVYVSMLFPLTGQWRPIGLTVTSRPTEEHPMSEKKVWLITGAGRGLIPVRS